jgi:myosin heavy subunit
MLFIAAALGLAVWGWGSIVPFVLTMMEDTVHLALLVGGAIVAGAILLSPRTHLLFQLAMNKLTGIVITIDPIGILENHLKELRKRRAKLDGQISTVSGSVRLLKDTIAKNHDAATQRMKEAAYAQQQLKTGKITDSTEQLRAQLQINTRANKAGRLEKANISYQQLLTKLQGLYDFLVKWAAHLDAYIEDTDDTVKQAKVQYETLNTAYSAFKTAMSIIKGNSTEDDMYNQDLEFLADDASKKLGEIDDVQRVATTFMDNLDVTNGAVTSDALAALDAYEAKVLTPGNTDTAFLLPGATSAQALPIKTLGADKSGVASASSGSDYSGLFK